MKVILYMAISLDGKTTGENEDVSWVTESDIERMDTLMEECGVMVMGKRTFESFGDDLPNDKALQVVMTAQQSLLDTQMDNVIFTNQSPKEVLTMLEGKGFSQVILAGGETLNTSFLKENLIDELRLIQKPLILGAGRCLFTEPLKKGLTLIGREDLGGGTQELLFALTSSA